MDIPVLKGRHVIECNEKGSSANQAYQVKNSPANTKIQTSDEAKSLMSQTIAALILQEQRDGKGAA